MKGLRTAFLCLTVTVAAICLLTACGFQSPGNPEQESSSVPSSREDSSESTRAEPELQAGSTAEETDYLEVTSKLMEALDTIDRIGGSNISMDPDTAFTDENGDEYRKVLDPRFSNTEDLRRYLEENLTDNLIKKRYAGILDIDVPRYQEINGELYGKDSPVGCGFPWTETDPEISGVTETGFMAVAEYDNYGAVASMTLTIVKDDGSWKIDSLDF